ncbi:hypothetical protein IFO70_08705 [Phormidium tenue FACHB-886]|nr:hypothetical protein [Phormidium tenue FACHB-886]
MNRWVLKSGALVSSTVAICGYINAAALGLAEPDSSPPPGSTPQEAAPKGDPSNPIKPIIQTAPDTFSPATFMSEVLGIRSQRLPNTIEKTYRGLLEQAQTMAGDDRFSEALATVTGIPKNSKYYNLAQQLQEDWSQELLQRAISECQQGQITTAISLLNIVPHVSEQHGRVVELRNKWQQQASALNQAIAAKQAQDWQGVAEALKQIEGTPLYQSSPVQTLLQQSIQKLYSPDQSLLNITPSSSAQLARLPVAASVNSSASTGSSSSTISLPPGASPQSSELPINLAQAMAWAQPPSQIALSPDLSSSDLSSPDLSSPEATSLEPKQVNIPSPVIKEAPSSPVRLPLHLTKQVVPPSEDAPIAMPSVESSVAPPELAMPENSYSKIR